MKLKTIFVYLLVGVLMAGCSGVEMVPAPQDTPVSTVPPQQPAQPTGTAFPARPSEPVASGQPIIRETEVNITSFDETPNPNPDDRVKIEGTQVVSLQPHPSILPQPGDDKLTRGAAFVDRAEVVTMESVPPRFALHLTGSTPTPCHHLRVKVAEPDLQNRIAVSAYTVYNPEMICTQVLRMFEVSIPMDNYPRGTYTVQVNEKDAGQFNVP